MSSNNSAGFTALPGGVRDSGNGSFNNEGNYGYWWSSKEYGSSNAWRRGLRYYLEGLGRNNYDKRLGISIRCLKD